MNKLKVVNTLSADKVEVEDEQGLRWIISTWAYTRFKMTGFPLVPKEVTLAFQYALNGKNFGDMSEQEKFEVMKKVIEAATHEPLEHSLPNLQVP